MAERGVTLDLRAPPRPFAHGPGGERPYHFYFAHVSFALASAISLGFSDKSSSATQEFCGRLGSSRALLWRVHGVEIRPPLVTTIQRLPQRTMDSMVPTR